MSIVSLKTSKKLAILHLLHIVNSSHVSEPVSYALFPAALLKRLRRSLWPRKKNSVSRPTIITGRRVWCWGTPDLRSNEHNYRLLSCVRPRLTSPDFAWGLELVIWIMSCVVQLRPFAANRRLSLGVFLWCFERPTSGLHNGHTYSPASSSLCGLI